MYEYNPVTGEYDKTTTIGNYVRSSSKNTSDLIETTTDANGNYISSSSIQQSVGNISLKVNTYYNLFYNAFFSELIADKMGSSPYYVTIGLVTKTQSTYTDISYGKNAIRMGGSYLSTSDMVLSSMMGSDVKGYGIYLAPGTYTFQCYAKVSDDHHGGMVGVQLVKGDSANFDNGSIFSQIAFIAVNSNTYQKYTNTFTLTEACYVAFRMFIAGVTSSSTTSFNLFIDAVMLEAGDTAPTTLVSSYNGSHAGDKAEAISSGLVSTGIDIENKKITMTADQFECQNNSGVKTALADRKSVV